MSAYSMFLDLAAQYQRVSGHRLEQIMLSYEDTRALKAELGAHAEYLLEEGEITQVAGIVLSRWGDPPISRHHLTVVGLSIEDHRMQLQGELAGAFARIDELHTHIEVLEKRLQKREEARRVKAEPFGRYFGEE